ncbi:UNKNOWN [Stylonychia lemnae]|uniref:Uncharacterized protein n=1 Tax=Stylonychia lemnae TaxID=5949 RepID=A0A078A1G5_STYLE|nr:UNKNOWN [Stylonychia lemnae]|eukprot:CDW75940.1 UNKNOWN [Stylonychia lemnae]
MDQPFDMAKESMRSAQQNNRKVPNLKNLRDMIKKNSTNSSQSPSNQINIKSERTNKNESECSFTLTSDEERDADGNSIGGRRSSITGKRSKGNKIPLPENQTILVQEAQSRVTPKSSSQTVVHEAHEREEADDDDQFLKELEEENKLLEEELKNLQSGKPGAGGFINLNSTNGLASMLPRQPTADSRKSQSVQNSHNPLKRKNSTSSQNSSGVPVQRKIRFQDEVNVSPLNIHMGSSSKKSLTPKRDSVSPYTSNRSNNYHKPSRSASSNQSLSPRPQRYPQPNINKITSPNNHTQSIKIQNSLDQQQQSLTNRSIQSISPSKDSSRYMQSISQPSNRDSLQHNHNLSVSGNGNQNQGTIDIEKYKSLELRLMGCMRTIKTLEKENQAKTDKIASLQLELEKKTKTIEQINNERMNQSVSLQRQSVQSKIEFNQRKKEKEQEQKLKDQESLITDQKKQMTRFQEMNKQLIEKVKEMEHQLLDKENMTTLQLNDASQTKKENQQLKNEIKQIKQDKKKSEYLERECQIIKDKYENLRISSAKFEEASQELYRNHQMMNEKMKLFIRQAAERGVLKEIAI